MILWLISWPYVKVWDFYCINSITYGVLSSHDLCCIKSRVYTMWCMDIHGQQVLHVSFRDYLPLEWFTLAYDYMTQGNTYYHRFGNDLMSMIWLINENTHGPCRDI